MQEQLNRVEKKLDKLYILVYNNLITTEGRLSNIETIHRGILGILGLGGTIGLGYLVKLYLLS